MKIFVLSTLCFCFISLSLYRVSSEETQQTSLSPRGWNSYDAFIWTISEQEFLESADIVSKRLKPHGYEYVVLDYLWYRKKVPGANVDSLGFDIIDEWGRMVPDPDRWPSSKGGKGLTEVAKKVHDMGLKFGIHIMRGLSTQAYNANTPILDVDKGRAFEDQSGKQWRAKDIGFPDKTCKWMPHGFMSINAASEAGKAFLRSLYKDYIEWGVDFIKLDCVFGDDFDKNEIVYVSELLKGVNRPLVFSLSPGANATPPMAKEISEIANMYRITGDDWDTWSDLAAHFNISRDFAAANLIGSKGLRGNSWPDLDMLPLGWLSEPATNEGPHRACRLTFDEQKTQITLWAMAKSPLMFGGDVRKLDDTTYSLITNPTVLEIDHYSSNNKEFTDILGLPMNKTTNNNKTSASANKNASAPKANPIFHLISCQDSKAQGWTTGTDQNQGKVCWKENSGNSSGEPICLYPRKLPLSAANNEQISAQHYQLSVLNSLAREETEDCLDASPKPYHASKLSGINSISKCRKDALQMWELNPSGTLVNNYSGQCATVNLVQVEGVADGIRSWIATGRRKGEIYVAFFNLNSDKMAISAKISDLAKALPGKKLNAGSCKCHEVWSGKNLGVLKDSVLIQVETHGTALLVLNC